MLRLPCCAGRRNRKLAEAAEVELLLASIDSLSTRLQGLRTDLRAAEEQSRSADQAELRHIRREHEGQSRLAMEAARELGAVEQRLLEAQTALQQATAAVARAQRRRDQLRDELQVGEESVRNAESGITQAKGVAEQVLVAMKQKVHELTETLADQTAMEELYATQVASLQAQVQSMEAEAAGTIDAAELKPAIVEFAASSDFDAHFAPIAELLHLTPMEQRRVIAARQRHLDDDPDDPR